MIYLTSLTNWKYTVLILAFLIVTSCGDGWVGRVCVGTIIWNFSWLNWSIDARLTQLIFLWQIQKFAMRFPSIYEAESFINALKVMVSYHNITIHKKIRETWGCNSITIFFPCQFLMIVLLCRRFWKVTRIQNLWIPTLVLKFCRSQSSCQQLEEWEDTTKFLILGLDRLLNNLSLICFLFSRICLV